MRALGEQEIARCEALGIDVSKVLKLEDLAKNDNVIFSATGITKGDLLDGITSDGVMATTETPADPRQIADHPSHQVDSLPGSQRQRGTRHHPLIRMRAGQPHGTA